MPFAPEGPAISSCPNFSASVILPISEVTWVLIDASRCLVAAETPVVGCWAEARAARLPEPAARVLTDPVVAAGTATSAAAASAVTPEAICAALKRRRGLRIIARPPYQGRRRADCVLSTAGIPVC